MRVVIDTSAIIESSLTLESPDFIALFSSMEQLNIELLVPQVVIDELVNKYEERLEAAEHKATESISTINKLVDWPIDSPFTGSLFALTESSRFRNRIEIMFRRHHVRILPYPSITHEETASRSMRRKKPFADNGSGYRDYLIWRSVMEELQSQPHADPLIFVTKNTNDFLHKSGNGAWDLHRDLRWDLDLAGIPVENVIAFDTLRSLKQAIIDPRLTSMSLLEAQVMTGEFLADQFSEGIKPAIVQWFNRHLHATEPSKFGLSDNLLIIKDVEVGELGPYQYADVRELPDGELTVNLTVVCGIDFHPGDENRSDSLLRLAALETTYRDVAFIISAIIGPEPERKVIAMDAILLYRKNPTQMID